MRLLALTIFLLCLALAALSQTSAPTGKVAQITIVHGGPDSPPHSVNDDAIRAVLTEKVGDPYSPESVQRDQRAIRGMGDFFRVIGNATADPAGGVDVRFTVAEYPVVRKIVIRANTPDSQPPVPAATLLAMMDTKVGRTLNLRTLRQDLNQLTNSRTGYLRQQGFLPEGGGYQIDFDQPIGVLTIHLREAHIAQIVVTGNSQVPAEDIIPKMQSQVGDVFDENKLKGDMSRLQATGLFQSVGPYRTVTTNHQLSVTVPVVERPNLALAAPPALTVQPGEIRVEGTIRDVDPADRRLTLLALHAQPPGRSALAFDPPRLEIIQVRPSTLFYTTNGERASWGAFQPGDAVIVIGISPGPGKPLPVRVIAAQ